MIFVGTFVILGLFSSSLGQLTCPGDSWVLPEDTNTCYLAEPGPLSWSDANAKCLEVDNARLATIINGDENAAILEVAGTGVPAWIGLQQCQPVQDDLLNGWYWKNNEPFIYQNWKPSPSTTGDCAVGAVTGGKWDRAECTGPYAPVCEIAPVNPTSCPDDFTAADDGTSISCYYYGGEDTQDAAYEECSDLDAHLVTLESPEEVTALTTFLTGESASGNYWIGAQYNSDDTTWIWLKKPENNKPVQFWGASEPDNTDDANLCAIMNADGTWSAAACGEEHPYVCKVPKDGENCNDDWEVSTSDDAFCYLTVTTAATQPAAYQDCKQKDPASTLVYIDTAAENAEIQTKVTDTNPWIGQVRCDTTSADVALSWMWVDGSRPVDYDNFPETGAGNGGCAQMVDGGEWNKGTCATPTGYICQAGATNPGGSSTTVQGSLIGIVLCTLWTMALM